MTPCNPGWRTEAAGGEGRRCRFPFLVPAEGEAARPLLWLRIAPAARPARKMRVPALIDSGAHASLGPRRLCEDLGLDFAGGRLCAASTGIAGHFHDVHAHDALFTVLRPPAENAESRGDEIAFGPMMFPLRFVDAPMPYLLLGQSDFLCRFALTMVPRRGYFDLEWLPA